MPNPHSTAYAWTSSGITEAESYAIVSGELQYTKLNVFMDTLFLHLKAKFQVYIKTVTLVFSDGVLKQRFLFSNLHLWEEENAMTGIFQQHHMTRALLMELVEWSCEQFGAMFEVEKAVQQHQ